MSDNEGGWVAYYSDWSGFAVFIDELLALRYAVANTMEVKRIEWGVDVREQVEGRRG